MMLSMKRTAEQIRDNMGKLYNEEGGYFVKGFLLQEDGQLQYDNTLDISSLYGAFMYSGMVMTTLELKALLNRLRSAFLILPKWWCAPL